MGKHWVHTLLNKRITPLTCILIATTVIRHQQHCAIDSDIDIDYNDSHSSFSTATASLTRTSKRSRVSSPLLIVVLSFEYILTFLHCQGAYISKRAMQPTHKWSHLSWEFCGVGLLVAYVALNHATNTTNKPTTQKNCLFVRCVSCQSGVTYSSVTAN